MKRFVFSVFSLFTILSVCAQPAKFTLKGDLSKLKAPVEWVYMSYMVNGQRITDSSIVRQDAYSFSGTISEPVQAGLRIRYRADKVSNASIPFNSKRDYAVIFLEPGSVTVTSVDSFANVSVNGSKADAEYRRLQELSKPYDAQMAALYAQSSDARKRRDTAAMEKLEQQIDSADAAANDKIYGSYLKENPSSPIAMYAFRNWAGYEIDAARVEPVFNNLPAAVRNSPSGKEMAEKIAIAKKTGIGQMAIDFTQNDTLGQPVALHSLRGKYLLVDFWASWCGPCRAENPNLVNTYHKYSDKGFQIVSVSLDRPGARDKWIKAIHDDQLSWVHVSDLQFWNNAVAKQYGIEAIPQNLLLDPTGKIIAKNLRGKALEAKLETIYTR